jgi:signal transduction histidine kinase
MAADMDMRREAGNTGWLNKLIKSATYYRQGRRYRRELFLPLDSATRIFILQKAIDLAEQHLLSQKSEEDDHLRSPKWLLAALQSARRLLTAEQMVAGVVERYPTTAAFEGLGVASVRRLDMPGDMYGLSYKIKNKTFLLIRSGEDVRRDLAIFENAFARTDVVYRILDDAGTGVIASAEPSGKAFLTTTLGGTSPNWKAQLYFKDSEVFTKAARREAVIYTWAGILVILLILVAGGFAGQTVSRQMKLSRLKNDFIATVSHELKTPLASMRVLVDTLLEGRYKGQQQATEYLQLVSQENERLSNLIDNFLTFSRMERNKQAFEMLATSPATVANRAGEAVSTKFEQGQCTFDISIDNDLPDVLADQDAMVTALVNLLDNAYKYSYDDKQIKLSVFAEVDSVCFRVADNGAGMSRRATKRIFDRFYQVDRSLTRRAEGCGLGLSIVKFIVDAHKGTIIVDSMPGKGSIFTIRLPAAG